MLLIFLRCSWMSVRASERGLNFGKVQIVLARTAPIDLSERMKWTWKSNEARLPVTLIPFTTRAGPLCVTLTYSRQQIYSHLPHSIRNGCFCDQIGWKKKFAAKSKLNLGELCLYYFPSSPTIDLVCGDSWLTPAFEMSLNPTYTWFVYVLGSEFEGKSRATNRIRRSVSLTCNCFSHVAYCLAFVFLLLLHANHHHHRRPRFKKAISSIWFDWTARSFVSMITPPNEYI